MDYLAGNVQLVIAIFDKLLVINFILLVVENGTIVEQGTHYELIERGGHYKELYENYVAGISI